MGIPAACVRLVSLCWMDESYEYRNRYRPIRSQFWGNRSRQTFREPDTFAQHSLPMIRCRHFRLVARLREDLRRILTRAAKSVGSLLRNLQRVKPTRWLRRWRNILTWFATQDSRVDNRFKLSVHRGIRGYTTLRHRAASHQGLQLRQQLLHLLPRPLPDTLPELAHQFHTPL